MFFTLTSVSGLQWGDLTEPSAAHLACIWSWLKINFHVMDSGKLIIVQLQIHARKLLVRTNYTLPRSVERAKKKKKIQARNDRCLYCHTRYMVNKSFWINVGKCNKHTRSPRARANQPPKIIYFQVRSIYDACASLWVKIMQLFFCCIWAITVNTAVRTNCALRRSAESAKKIIIQVRSNRCL